MRTLLSKEFYWNWRSFRYPALILVFVFFALLNPPTIKYMNEILSLFAGVEGIGALLPEPTAQEAMSSVFSDLSQIGVLVLIFVTMGIVAREKETGVAGWMLSKPVGRSRYLLAKVITLYATIVLGLAAASLLAYLYTWSLLGRVGVQGVLWAYFSLATYMILMGSLTFALSTLLRTPLQAGGVAVVVFFLSGIGNLLVSGSSLVRSVYPNTLLGKLGPLVYGASQPGDVAGALAVTLAMALVIVALAVRRFSRMEL